MADTKNIADSVESTEIAEKNKTLNGHQNTESQEKVITKEVINGETVADKVNGELANSNPTEVDSEDKSSDEENASINGDDNPLEDSVATLDKSDDGCEAAEEDEADVSEVQSETKSSSSEDDDDDKPLSEIKAEQENAQLNSKSNAVLKNKDAKDLDDDIQIVKDDESDIEMIEAPDPLSLTDEQPSPKNKKQNKKEDISVVTIVASDSLMKPAFGKQSTLNNVHPKTSVSAAAQTTGTTNITATLQNALHALTVGPGQLTPTLQNVYLSAIQQVLLSQGNPQGTNQQHLANLQQYYNTVEVDEAYVIEAPSFIAPYVMEGKPKESIPDFLKRLEKESKENESNDKKEDTTTTDPVDKSKKNTDSKDQSSDNKEESPLDKSKAKQNNKKEDTKETAEKSENKDKDEDEEDKEEDKRDTQTKEEEQDKDDIDYKVKDNSDDDSSSTDSDDDVIDLESEELKNVEDLSHLGRWEPFYRSELGKFVLDIGLAQAQEFIQQDLLKMQKRKLDKMKTNPSKSDVAAYKLLDHQLQKTRQKNSHLATDFKTCKFCTYKSESETVMSRHLESPHMSNYTYKCNFCEFETRGPQVILFHMEAEHTVRGRLERAPAFFQCPLCPFEDNNKSKMTRHAFSCVKRFKADKNCELSDWEPPAKIPKLQRSRGSLGGRNMDASKMPTMLSKTFGGVLPAALVSGVQGASPSTYRGRGRPVGSYKNISPALGKTSNPVLYRSQAGTAALLQQMQGVTTAQLTNQVLQNVNNKSGGTKSPQQPSISITPLPRGGATATKNTSKDGSKPTFVICEICDGYIKDLEQLRNHMNLIHHVKIHPKMIYNRPPLNCQKCQHRFFTDQGLERHLLGNHGLVTSSMQDASNKGKDAGRCPICGKVFQWKLLSHVSKDHKMTLKPAHLSYKCTVCTATFNMYRLFENHVYSAHSVVNKNKNAGESSTAAKKTADGSLKINDEITIIPQPAQKTKSDSSQSTSKKDAGQPVVSKEITITKVGSRSAKRQAPDSVEIISLDESPKKPEPEPKRRTKRSKQN